MKVNINGQVLVGYDDRPLKMDASPNAPDSTLKAVVYQALTVSLPGDEGQTKEAKYSFYKLAKKVKNSQGELDLTVEQLGIIKDRVAKAYPPLIIGQVYEFIEGESD